MGALIPRLELPTHGVPFGATATRRGLPARLGSLGTVPVPLRQRVRDGVADLVQEIGEADAPPLRCCFPMGQGGRGPFERLRYIRALADYPGMLVSAEHGNAFNRRFYRIMSPEANSPERSRKAWPGSSPKPG